MTDKQPTSTRLTEEEIAALEKIAKALGVTPHFVRRLAIDEFIKNYRPGWKPAADDILKQVKKTKKEE